MAKLIALGTLLVAGLLGLTPAAYAESAALEWAEVSLPTEGEPGGWELAPGTDIGPLGLAADGTLYAAKLDEDGCSLMVSGDGGRSWSESDYEGEAVTDIVGSSLDAETIYLSDGGQVYKSDDGGESFVSLSAGTLPAFDENEAIVCLDIAYDAANHPIVFIGTADSDAGEYGGIYYLAEGDFGAGWNDMAAGDYDVYSLAGSPAFDQDFRLIALASDESHSYIINNDGGIGDWSLRTELLEDNAASFAASGASRICFPAYFDSFYELFVGVSAGANGGVFRVNEDSADDLGLEAAIVSLALAEDDGDIKLLAGGAGGGVWLSPDGGESWEQSQKAPSGEGETRLVLAADFADSGLAYAATSGAESAFSVSRDGGLTWNQLSLVDSRISDIIDLAPSPQYRQDSTLFLLTHYSSGQTHSLWRSPDGGESWERVYGSALPEVETLERVLLSPDYDEDNQLVLLAGVGDGSPSIWKSTDNGQSFARYSTPLPVDVWAMADDSHWFIGGYDGERGVVYHTANGGRSYSDGVTVGEQSLRSIALSPDYSEDGTILVGNKDGWVYRSEDNGQSFQPMPSDAAANPLSGEIYVAFDPDYASNGTVYAASGSAGEGIYRFSPDDDWESIDSPDEAMLGAIVVGAAGTLYAANFDADGGMERCLNPTYSLGPTFESVTKGLEEGATLVGLWLSGQRLWSIDDTNKQLVSYSDSLTSAVSLTTPVDGVPGVGLLVDGTVRSLELDWETLSGATEYQWQLNDEEDFSSLPEGFEDTTRASSAHPPALEPMTTYYWRVRAIEPVLSPWSEKWSFTTTMGSQSSAPELESPTAGASGVAVAPIFQWSAIAGADSYELMVSTIITFDNPTILKTEEYALPATAWQCNVSLVYDTTYYWKVRAVSTDSYSAWSAVSAFHTEVEPSLETGTVAELSEPENTPENTEATESSWRDWLLTKNGVSMLIMALLVVAVLVTLIIVVVKVSRL